MINPTRIPRAEMRGIYAAVLKIGMRKMLGGVPAGAQVSWHNPLVFKDMMKFGRRVQKWNRLDRNLSSFAAMAAAAEIGCSFCLDFNYFMSHNHQLDEAKARQVPRWRESEVFTPLERRVMEYAEAMCHTVPSVTDEMSAALLAEIGARALVELTAKVAFMNATARSNIALGIHSEGYAEACGLAPLATRSGARTTPDV